MNARHGESGPHGITLKSISSSQHVENYTRIRLIIIYIWSSFLRDECGRSLEFTSHIRVVSFLKIYEVLFPWTLACYAIRAEIWTLGSSSENWLSEAVVCFWWLCSFSETVDLLEFGVFVPAQLSCFLMTKITASFLISPSYEEAFFRLLFGSCRIIPLCVMQELSSWWRDL